MSTKTTFKRVALVAVAALGLGLLSVAPSNAAIAADTLAVTDGTATIGESVTATSATATLSFIASAASTDSHSVTASLVSGPATSTQFPILQLAETSSAKVSPYTGGGESATGTNFDAYTKVYVVASGSARATAKFAVFIGNTANAGVAVAGTYVVRITPAAAPTAGTATFKDITITVAAAAKATQAYTQLGLGTNNPTAALGAVDSVVAGSKVASTTIVGKLAVSLRGASGSEIAESYTATITGAGSLGQAAAATTSTGTVIGRSITMVHGNHVLIFADGTSGVGTVTITNAAGAVLATKTVTFYGDAAVVTLSSNSNAVVGTLTAPIKATVYDASGYVVAGVQLYATSADTAVISNSYSKVTSTTSSKGEADVALTGVKLGSAKITVGLATSATDVTTTGYAVKSDALTVTVGGSANEQAGVVVTTDKQVYTPGSYAYVTVKAVDKDGKTLSPLASSAKYTVFATGGISASLPIETVTGIISAVDFTPSAKAGTATAADPIVAQAGEAIYKIKLPAYVGDLTLSWTTAAASYFPANIAAGAVAGSVTVTLSDPGSQAAVDAAAEATDAANAATDAALAAADAADAATAAAEDASASVAKLSKSVTTALNNLKKQITSLTALVNKLLKR
jgi:trimeric autotransporter adhesin